MHYTGKAPHAELYALHLSCIMLFANAKANAKANANAIFLVPLQPETI